jgi:RsiW-degrading membrane proteinase PrsW (M82 family)
MLWAAILFIWEFVGIDLEKAKETEGYAGALIKSIKSPQAIPWVLLALVIYFLFKCSTDGLSAMQTEGS